VRFEILQASDKEKPVAQFIVQELSLLSFPEWKTSSVVEMPLIDFAAKCETIELVDDALSPLTVAVRVHFYLPAPVEERMLALAVKNGTDREKACSPSLTWKAIFGAVVDEIKHNHVPNDQYIVRISE
jgi:hypothetical protein